MHADDELIPMAALPFAEEALLRALLDRWLPPVRGAPDGPTLGALVRTPAQGALVELVTGGHDADERQTAASGD
jgi:hypothetical protein